MQNISHAVMAQRFEARTSLDDFPSPPWAARAFIEHVILPRGDARNQTCLEPACGRGHMASTLAEYFGHVAASDIHPYGFGDVLDFTDLGEAVDAADWVITNPPFRLAEAFLQRAFSVARVGVAILQRTAFMEGVRRYETMFGPRPPTRVAQYAERVPMVRSRLDRSASTATSYAWFVWEVGRTGPTELVWIPRSRRRLERDSDYEDPVRPGAHQHQPR
jgi:predicted RNA methylase